MPRTNQSPPAGAKAKRLSVPEPRVSPPAAEPSPGDPTTLRRRLLRHFDGKLLTRIEATTGHRPHLLWHNPDAFRDPASPPLLCPKACASHDSGLPLSGQCAICQRDRWCPHAPASGRGRQVRGACGAHGFWAVARVGPLRPLSLALHTDTLSPRFARAVKLLLLVIRKVETSHAAEQADHDLDQSLKQPPHTEASAPRYSHSAHVHSPHAAGVVRAMLDYVRNHYHQPLDLAAVAESLGMNASYLSSLFAAHLGVHFHHYLCEFRLAKAMELLCDPFRRISDIAAATGHTSPNHFNNLFKSMTGMSPSAWRNANTASGGPPQTSR